jgi:hypothetical protein
MNKTLLPIIALLLAVCGCSSDYARFGPYYTPRVNAAKSINDESMRDEALRRVGQIAIDGGDAIAANDAVDAIHSSDVKDDLASGSARKLNSRQQWGQATSMAKKITDVELRDRILREIATGKG